MFPLLIAGCYKPAAFPEIVTAPSASLNTQLFAGTSIKDREIKYMVLGDGWDVTFILASIHGNEPAGTKVVFELADYLQKKPALLEGRKVVLLPVANPDGIAKNRRHNARGVDLNRNFPAANRRNNKRFGRSALSEPEARIIHQLISKYDPDRIISIHQLINNKPGSLSEQTPFGCIDHDGPATAIAETMAQYSGLPIRKLGARPGSLGSYAGLNLSIPIITLELPRDSTGRDSRSLWNLYGKAMVAVVTYPQPPE